MKRLTAAAFLALALSGCVVRESNECEMRCLWCFYVELRCETDIKTEADLPTNDKE